MDKLKILLRLIFCVRPILAVLEKNLPREGLILDLGCGYGIISHFISKTCKERKVIGIDVASHRIKVAQSSIAQKQNIEFHATDIRKYKIPICDAIIMIDVLCLIPYQEQEYILVRCYESLKDDGIMIIKDSAKSPFWKYAYMNFEEWLKVKLGVYGKEVKRSDLYVWDSKDFMDVLIKIGFNIAMIPMKSNLPYPGVFYICRKERRINNAT